MTALAESAKNFHEVSRHQTLSTVDGRKTSVSLEDVFWDGLREVAKHRTYH
jgi:predicted DNA-binding ribbon-helix-helix protein